MSTEPRARAWVEIREGALRRNLRRVREAVGPGPALIPMVKADAYGLGVARAVEALEAEDPWGYGVATVAEGLELRGLGVARPILVISPVPPGGEVERAVAAGLTLAISDASLLRGVRDVARTLGRRASVHVEIDTGMGRAGFPWDRAGEWGPVVAGLADGDPVVWEGCFTHYHSADVAEGAGDGDVEGQARRFEAALAALPPAAVGGALRHLANSAGALRRPDLAADAVRPGIFLFGGRAGAGLPAPEPVVEVRARIVLVRDVPAGSTTGYGATYRAGRPERWATVAIGYADGLRRSLSNRGHALVRGARVPIVGRISMDMTVVDITDLPESGAGPVEAGEIATFVGRDGAAEILLDDVADTAGTIGYEILTGLAPRLPRVWIPDDALPGTAHASDGGAPTG